MSLTNAIIYAKRLRGHASFEATRVALKFRGADETFPIVRFVDYSKLAAHFLNLFWRARETVRRRDRERARIGT